MCACIYVILIIEDNENLRGWCVRGTVTARGGGGWLHVM